MVDRYLPEGVAEKSDGGAVWAEIERAVSEYKSCFEQFNIKGACEVITDLTNFANKYIDDKKPWVMAKAEDSDLGKVLYDLLELVKWIGVMLLPVVPDAAAKILESVGLAGAKSALDDEFGCFEIGHRVVVGPVIFPRIEV